MELSRRQFLTGTAAVATVAALPKQALATGQPIVPVEEQTFEVPGLHPAHDGLRIAQISDIHVGPRTGEEMVRAAIATVNAQNPDLVVLTGDYLCHDRKAVGLMKEQLGGLKAPTVAILGNHDHWVDAAGAKDALVRLGYAVLQNQHEQVTLKGERFSIVGIDDLWTGHAEPVRAFKGAPFESRIVLAHVPRTAKQLAAMKEPMVVLSGHTHGGQLNIPGVTSGLMRLVTREPYDRGRFRIGDVQLYVNRGIGLSGIPVRINAPPEVTVITLRSPPPVGLKEILYGLSAA
jgi:predicted MPP superfamily phosphohydrolase